MALTKCRECKKEISKSAKTCPLCGVKNPGGWLVYQGTGCGGCVPILLAIICALLLLGFCSAFAV